MTTIEERAKRICTNSFCNKLHKPICKTCIWRCNRELTELQCSVPEYKDAIESVYDSAICQLLLQREELTSWRDPKDIPKNFHNIIVKYKSLGGVDTIAIVWRYVDRSRKHHYMINGTIDTINSGDIIGWRPIHV